jgi:hypothetical protein
LLFFDLGSGMGKNQGLGCTSWIRHTGYLSWVLRILLHFDADPDPAYHLDSDPIILYYYYLMRIHPD